MAENKDIKELLILAKKIESHLDKLAKVAFDPYDEENEDEPFFITTESHLTVSQFNFLGELVKSINENIIIGVNNTNTINNNLLNFKKQIIETVETILMQLGRPR